MKAKTADLVAQWFEILTATRFDSGRAYKSAVAWLDEAAATEDANAQQYALSAMAMAHYRLGRFESMMPALGAHPDGSSNTTDVEAMACRYYALAALAYCTVDEDLALRLSAKAARYACSGKHRELAAKCVSLYASIGAYKAETELLESCRSLLDRLVGENDRRVRSMALNDLALLGFSTGRYASGVKYAHQAVALAEGVGDLYCYSSAVGTLAMNYGGIGRPDMAEQVLREIAPAFGNCSMSHFQGFVEYDVAQAFGAAGFPDIALEVGTTCLLHSVQAKQWLLARKVLRFINGQASHKSTRVVDVDPNLAQQVDFNIAQRRSAIERVLH